MPGTRSLAVAALTDLSPTRKARLTGKDCLACLARTVWCSYPYYALYRLFVGLFVINIPMDVESVPNRNSPPAVLLRESFRQNGRVRKTLEARWRPVRVEPSGANTAASSISFPPLPSAAPSLACSRQATRDELGSEECSRTRAAKLALFRCWRAWPDQGSRLRIGPPISVAEVLGSGRLRRPTSAPASMIRAPAK